MSKPSDVPAYEIARLRMEPGDVLVVKIHSTISGEQAAKVREQITSQIPGKAQVMVIDRNVDLSILSRAEIEKRAAA